MGNLARHGQHGRLELPSPVPCMRKTHEACAGPSVVEKAQDATSPKPSVMMSKPSSVSCCVQPYFSLFIVGKTPGEHTGLTRGCHQCGMKPMV
jgi:hypothetical protein